MAEDPHVPVLADAVVRLADVQPGDTVVDGTFGNGGHARLLATALEPGRGTYVGIDRDPSVEPRFAAFASEHEGLQTRFVRATFPDGMRDLAAEGVSADVVILDIGVSSMQLDQPERGFAYSYDAPLDMRMDPGSPGTAADLVNEAPEAELTRILREYGEERYARRIARAIVARRAERPFERTADLVDVIRGAVPAPARFGHGHPAKRTFQALRIAVNAELEMLDEGLDAALALLRPGGRLVVISFHSLEDRMVKRRFEHWASDCICPPGLPICACDKQAEVVPLTRKPVEADLAEVEANPRAASAKVRAVRKLEVAA